MSRPTEPTVQVSDDLPGRQLPDASGANAGSADPVAVDLVERLARGSLALASYTATLAGEGR